jgi:DEAD/DEAH box helicase domain-containing protein
LWGRAGRRDTGLALYVAGDDALDQFFCRHPDEFLDRRVESAILDHESEQIHRAHLAAAAYEMPLSPADAETLGPRWEAYAERLVSAGELRERGGRYMPRGPGFPAQRVSLRSSSTDSFTVLDAASGELLGTVEAARAPGTVHPGAIYLHMGRSYEVEQLDSRERRAIVQPFDGDWYTQPKKETDTFIERIASQRSALGVELYLGTVSVTEQVVAFQRKRVSDHEVIDLVGVDLPEQHFVTQALWYEVPEGLLGADFPLERLLGSLHAAEHTQIAVLPLIAMCDRWDIGGLSTNLHPQTGRPTVFIYDGHPGGVGIAAAGFGEFEALVEDARRLIGECPCRAGCPSCVQSPKCGNLNEPLSKAGALELLDRMRAGSAEPAAAAG